MKIIGMDLGTTGISGVLTEDGKVLAERCEDANAFIATGREWEKIQDVERIIGTATEILNALIDAADGDVSAIGVTGQMHGILYFDENGEAVSPLYTWQDKRGDLPYKKTTYAAHLGSFAGYGNVTDFYNRENAAVPADAVSYCTVYDYFVMRLTGNKKPLLHASSAASFGLYNPEKKSFKYPYRPKVTDGFALAGAYRGIPVALGIGDNQASVFATLESDAELLINIGTGSQVSLIANRQVSAENIECRPYFDGKYLIVGAALCGGRAYSLLKDFYADLLAAAGKKSVDVYRVMAKLMGEETASDLKVDTRFAGTRNAPDVRGSITNLGVDNFTPRALTLGVLRGMIDELYTMYRAMGIKKHRIVASGNGIRKNKTLLRIAEEVFGQEIRVSKDTEEAAKGAAKYALCALKKKAKQ